MTAIRVGVIDLGMGNIGAVGRSVAKLGAAHVAVRRPDELDGLTHLILPGVGNFGRAMAALDESGLRSALERMVLQEQVPLMGICLGMQMLFESSEESDRPGLGWIPGRVVRFRADQSSSLKVPLIGWNRVSWTRDGDGLPEDERFYFVHSFHVSGEPSSALGTSFYGYRYVSAIEHRSIVAYQFHPEKSREPGVQLFRRFLSRARS